MNKLIYKHYKIPLSYLDTRYEDTGLSNTKALQIEEKLRSTPKRGLLVISGTAAPVINQLISRKLRVTSINFPQRSGEAFTIFDNPKSDVILITGVGMEVTLNYAISRQVLHALLKHYGEQDTLIVIETHFTKSMLRDKYDLTPNNFLIIPLKEEEVFI